MIIKQTHVVPDGVEGIRFSDYAVDVFTIIPSRKGIKKAIKRGELLINGEPATTATWVHAGQRIDYVDQQDSPHQDFSMTLEVVYEDDYLAVINKPPGIEVNGNKFKTVENALPGNLTPSGAEGALSWPRPVHRLDYSTTGLLLIAKTLNAQVDLGHQFQERRVKKRYRAVVVGVPSSERGTINSPIDGQEAESTYQVIRTVRSLKNEWLTLVDLFPRSGRRYQLRIHMADLGTPVLGDALYGKEGLILKSKGIFLSAVEIAFLHPVFHEEQRFVIEQPEKFDTFLAREGKRWKRRHQQKRGC